MVIDTASFLLFIVRVCIAVIITIALPIILMPKSAWSALTGVQWAGVLVILVLLVIQQSILCWPRFKTIRKIEQNAKEKLFMLMSDLMHDGIVNFIPGATADVLDLRMGLLFKVHTHMGFSRRLCMIMGTGSLLIARFFLWSKNEGFCGKSWKSGNYVVWDAGDNPENDPYVNLGNMGLRNGRPGLCVPITDDRGKVRGVFYVDFQISYDDSGLPEDSLYDACPSIQALAETLFLTEIPKNCIVGNV